VKKEDKLMKTKLLIVAAVFVIAATTGCTNKEGETEAPVFLTVDLADQAGLTAINPPRTVTIPSMVVTSHLKNPTQTDPQGFADVQLNRYTVVYRRADGGTIVPPVQNFAAGFLVPSGGSATLTAFPIISQTAIQNSPFDQLFPFNGGIDRETGSNEIRMFYDVTFYGVTASGHRVQSETATGIRIFVFE
jgi:hypothetical protein